MQMIEIAALENGAHRNQTFHGHIPDGWALIPDEMEIPATFPFVDIEADGDVVVKMAAGTVPEPVEEASEPGPTEAAQLRADVDFIAAMTGVELI